MERPSDARALASLLRARRDIDGPGMFVPPGERAVLMARLRRLASSDPADSDCKAGPDAPCLPVQGGAAEIEAIDSITVLRRVAESCTRCALHESRRTVVFADGSERARVMCVGEAPGAREDETGVPFVGRAGQLLDRLLLSVGLAREDVYVANVLKCRPPGNRNPQPEEIEECSPFLRRQVAFVEPEVVIAFGTFAAQTLLGVKESLGRLRGRVYEYEGVPLVATYHPAALLRNPQWTRPSWEDLQTVRRLLAESADG
ncbi:MAG: uracil-DNA glycosylase [Gemmatimonadota bacterium]